MARKSNKINKEKLEAKRRLEEIEQLEQLAIKEENDLVVSTKTAIEDLVREKGFFCGVILTPSDLAAVVKMAVESKENVKIGFQLYFTDNA